MRPIPGNETFTGRSRSASFVDNDLTPTPLASRNQQPQMTYFLTDEKSIDSSHSESSTNLLKQRETIKNSTYGVESLETTITSLASDGDDQEEKLANARQNWKKSLGQRMSRFSEEDLASLGSPSPKSSNVSRNVSPSHQRRSSQATLSRPFTPLSFGSPAPPSIMSSPGSRRDSDAGSFMDDTGSQAIASSGEDERESASEMLDSGSAPQLVMPSIKMPSRRPFTERGKNMGRLKVLIAGDSGVGKTSLIKAIVQACEDIVHVDPLSATPVSNLEIRRKSSKSKSRCGSADMESTSQITEVYASTKPYPSWWSELEESRVLRRRKSMGDSVLERNLCFVDTPGYGNKNSFLESITPVVEYIECHLQKAASLQGATDSDLLSMLSGDGGSQVDVVLYVFIHRVKQVDIEYLRRISSLTNVIPILAHADKLSSEQLISMKTNILAELQAANIRPFLFGLNPEDAVQFSKPTAPYAISTVTTKDHENMDASLLMSPDYVQPLVKSELSALVEQIFERDTISWLRHSAAKKFLQWRSSSSPVDKPQSLYRPLSSSTSIVASSQALTAPVGATTSYALARITDHTQREERIAQVRLANWAADLQRSLQNERARFEALARSDRALWLTERLGECVQDGTIVPMSQARQPQFSPTSGALVKQGTYSRKGKSSSSLNPQDPLGLLQFNSEMKRRGWIALQVVSGFGIIGGLALWISSWETGSETGFWKVDWANFSLLDPR